MGRLLGGLIRLAFRGRLGNRLTQYCVARRIATELGFGLSSEPIPGFPNAVALGPSWRWHFRFLGKESIDTAHDLDLEAIVKNRRPRIIDLRGMFLRYEFVRPYKEAIRSSWLLSGACRPHQADDLTIHVRGGDIWRMGPRRRRHVCSEYHALPFSFYSEIIRERHWRRIYVVTADKLDPMVHKIVDTFGAEVVSGDVLDDFNFMRSSQNLVMSVSSFAWWAGWLSDARRIYYPLAGLLDPERGARRPMPWRQNLWVFDEPRYIAIKPRMREADWSGTEEDRMSLLNS
jgi:hypothetical protein